MLARIRAKLSCRRARLNMRTETDTATGVMQRFALARAEVARRVHPSYEPLALCILVHSVARRHELSNRQCATLRLQFLTLPRART